MIALHKTRQTRVLYIISILIAGGALVLVLFLHFRQTSKPVDVKPLIKYDDTISLGQVQIPVTIADTPEKQEQGLSNTISLPENAGKFFVFKDIGKYGFWMKDMNYSLDIIWIDENLKIIAISKDLKPETYPTVFYPPSPVKYVLEVNAGFSTRNNIIVNQLLTFSHNLSF
jgi:uncharacterized membrane protein (UPF0127 family)